MTREVAMWYRVNKPCAVISVINQAVWWQWHGSKSDVKRCGFNLKRFVINDTTAKLIGSLCDGLIKQCIVWLVMIVWYDMKHTTYDMYVTYDMIWYDIVHMICRCDMLLKICCHWMDFNSVSLAFHLCWPMRTQDFFIVITWRVTQQTAHFREECYLRKSFSTDQWIPKTINGSSLLI